MRRSSAEGVILKIIVIGESDLLVRILTPGYGPMMLVARRALKSVKRFGGRLLLFNVLRFDYSRRKRGDIAYMENAAIMESFTNIFTDMENMCRVALLAEVVMSTWGEGDPAHNVFSFFIDYLRRMDAGGVSEDRDILDAFRLLDILGHRPMLDVCACCGGELGNSKMYSVNEGGTVCRKCAGEESDRLRARGGTMPCEVSPAVRRTLEKAYGMEPRFLDRVKFSSLSRPEARNLWLSHVRAIMGRTPKSNSGIEKFKSA